MSDIHSRSSFLDDFDQVERELLAEALVLAIGALDLLEFAGQHVTSPKLTRGLIGQLRERLVSGAQEAAVSGPEDEGRWYPQRMRSSRGWEVVRVTPGVDVAMPDPFVTGGYRTLEAARRRADQLNAEEAAA